MGEGFTLRDLGKMESKLGRDEAAGAAYGEALNIFRDSRDLRGQAEIHRHLGIWKSQTNPKLAKPHFLAAADAYESHGDTRMAERMRQKASQI